MCVATAIVIGVGAAGAIGSAKIQSNAAKRAGQEQTAAGDKALAFQREQYQQARADFAPYQQASNGALGALTTRAGMPSSTFRPGAPGGLGPPPTFIGTQLGTPVGPGMPPSAAQTSPGGPIGPAGGPPAGAVGGVLWTLQAPDGTTKQYPADVAQQFVARGATRVA